MSIINAGDVGAIPTYAEMAKKLGIPWCAITDEDLSADGITQKPTETARKKLETLKTERDRSLIWKGKLEKCLGKVSGKADAMWISQQLEPNSADEIEAKYPGYASVGKEVIEWAGQRS